MESTTRSTPSSHTGPVWTLTDDQVTQALLDTDRQIKQLSGRLLTLIGQVDARGIGTALGSANTAQWLAGILRIPGKEAGGTIKLARHVDRELPATAHALETGDISIGHARVISHVVRDLPTDYSTPELRAKVDATLVTQAMKFDAPTVRKLGQRVLETIDPELADQILAKNWPPKRSGRSGTGTCGSPTWRRSARGGSMADSPKKSANS